MHKWLWFFFYNFILESVCVCMYLMCDESTSNIMGDPNIRYRNNGNVGF
jgi:hypothetical protein